MRLSVIDPRSVYLSGGGDDAGILGDSDRGRRQPLDDQLVGAEVLARASPERVLVGVPEVGP